MNEKDFVHLLTNGSASRTRIKETKKTTRRGRPSFFTDLQIREIIDGHKRYMAKELAGKFGCSHWAIKQIWYRNGINGKNRRKYTLDLNYFKNIDTPAKAYFLGFIAADGCVQRTVRGPLSLTRKLNQKDDEILVKFLQQIGSNRHISHAPYLTQKRKMPRVASYIIITGNQICEDLAKFNIVERKTLNYKPVALPDELMRHFLRGYFDGDGTVFRVRRLEKPRPSDYRFAISLNRDTADFFHRYLSQYGIHSTIVEDKKSSLYQLRVSSNSSKVEFIDLLYKDADGLYLTRKKILADSYIACHREYLERI